MHLYARRTPGWPGMVVLLFACLPTARAAMTINSVTLNGGTSVCVAPNASITAVVSETNDSNSNWRSTQWTITATTCVNHPNHDGNNPNPAVPYTETFLITAPATPGTYTVTFRARSNDSCGATPSNLFTMTNAITVSTDGDGDGLLACTDNCPTVSNANQTDGDGDGVGDACDNCPTDSNSGQQNADGDSAGDACDGCPNDAAKTSPGVCGCGVADSDSDSDGTADCNDNCPDDANPSQADCDADGVGDACEPGAADCNVNGIPDECEFPLPTNNGLSFFFDTRDTMSNSAINGGKFGNAKWDCAIVPWTNEPHGGGRGDAQVVFVSPVIPASDAFDPHYSPHIFMGEDSSVQSAYLYMDVEDLPGDGDIVSAVGLDMILQKDAGLMSLAPGPVPAGLELTVFNSAADVGGGATTDAWDSVDDGTVSVNGVDGMKLSRTPSYPDPEGLGVGGSYRLAKLTFKGGPRGPLPTTVGAYSLKLSVNDGLILRVYDPAGPSGQTPELPDFGYVGGGPEAASVPGISGANGSSEGTTSPAADLTLFVQAKGDMDHNGMTDLADITRFVNSFNAFVNGANSVSQTWPIWPADLNDTNTMEIADISGFIRSFMGWYTP